MDSRLTTVILWYLVGLISVSYSQDQDDLNLENVFCTCMPYHKCKKNSTQVTPGTSEGNEFGEELIDIKVGSDQYPEVDNQGDENRITPEEGRCKHYLLKCCFPEDKPTPKNPPNPPTTENPVKSAENLCGRKGEIGFRIIGAKNNEANYGEFPWMVAVIWRNKENASTQAMECGGSIIHPLVILTATHCVKGKHGLYIRAGEWDTQTENEAYPTQERDVKEVIMHEDYYGGGLHNDIALLILDKPLELNQVVGTLCLPEQDENMDNRNCVISGWGKDVFGKEGKYQVILKKVEQPTWQHELCEVALRKTRLGPKFRLHKSLLCAGGEIGKDACKGDGGSPLACPSKEDSNVYVQAGIVAWGIGCGTGTPSVYVKVPLFRNWIENQMRSHNLQL